MRKIKTYQIRFETKCSETVEGNSIEEAIKTYRKWEEENNIDPLDLSNVMEAIEVILKD